MSKTKKIETKQKPAPQRIDISQEIMAKVKAGEINMKPKWYFLAGSSLLFAGMVVLLVLAIFLFNLIAFILRRQGPMQLWRLEMLLTNLPIWIPLLALLAVWGGITLLKKYDFSYKKNFFLIVLALLAAMILAALSIDSLGLNELWSKKEPMRRFYQNLEGKNLQQPLNNQGEGRQLRQK